MTNKSFLSITLITCVIFACQAWAEGGSCAPDGDTTSTCHWDVTDGVLTISGTGTMKDFDTSMYNNLAPWSSSVSSITKINIDEGITSIGRGAFSHMQGVKQMFVPNTVTAINDYAFRNMRNVSVFLIPPSVTYLGSGMYHGGIFLNTYGQKLYEEGSSVATQEGWRYQKDENGVYTIRCNYACPNNISKYLNKYYASLEDIAHINETGGYWDPVMYTDYDACKEAAAAYQLAKAAGTIDGQAQALLNQGNICQTFDDCKALVLADYNGEILNVNGKDYASLADLMSGNYIPKRIYTVEEASRLSKPTGNTFRIRYK